MPQPTAPLVLDHAVGTLQEWLDSYTDADPDDGEQLKYDHVEYHDDGLTVRVLRGSERYAEPGTLFRVRVSVEQAGEPQEATPSPAPARRLAL